MKEKLVNVCGKLLVAALVIWFGWGAVEMFRQGAWVQGAICVAGMLLFGASLVTTLFSRPAEPEPVPLVPQIDFPADKDSSRELAKWVAAEETDVMQMVEELLASPEAFCSTQATRDGEYADEYREVSESYHDKPDLLCSEGLRLVLEETKVIAMFDWKEMLEEFVDQMTELRRVQTHGLPVPKEQLDEAADIPHWCHALNELWQPLGYQTILLDTKGDEYLVAVMHYTSHPPYPDDMFWK